MAKSRFSLKERVDFGAYLPAINTRRFPCNMLFFESRKFEVCQNANQSIPPPAPAFQFESEYFSLHQDRHPAHLEF